MNVILNVKNDVRNHVKANSSEFKVVAPDSSAPPALRRQASREVTQLDGGPAALVRQLSTELKGEGFEVPEPVLLDLVRQSSAKHLGTLPYTHAPDQGEAVPPHNPPDHSEPPQDETKERSDPEQVLAGQSTEALAQQISARAVLVRRTSLGQQRSQQDKKDSEAASPPEEAKECGICRCEDGETDEEDPEPVRVLVLQCGHFYCEKCLMQQLLSKWPGLRLTFGCASSLSATPHVLNNSSALFKIRTR